MGLLCPSADPLSPMKQSFVFFNTKTRRHKGVVRISRLARCCETALLFLQAVGKC